MKKNILIGVIIFAPFLIFAQKYEYKYGFEDWCEMPKKAGDYSLKNSFSPSVGNQKATPDYFHQDASGEVRLTNFIFGKTYFGKTKAHSGNAAAGIIAFKTNGLDNYYYEYITIKLDNYLKIGRKYKISVWLKKGECEYDNEIINLSGLFTTNKIIQNNYACISKIPQCYLYPTGYLSNWTEVQDTFIADSSYQYATIGCFDCNKHNSQLTYYFIDDFYLQEVGNDEYNNNLYCYPGDTLVSKSEKGSQTKETTVNFQKKKGRFKISYDMYDISDSIIVYNSNDSILYDKDARGRGIDFINFDTQKVRIKVKGNAYYNKTSWKYAIFCPD